MLIYRIGEQDANGIYGICAEENGVVIDKISDITEDYTSLKNLVFVLNANKLPLPCFHEIIERMIGVLV